MSKETLPISDKKAKHASPASYIVGFVLSLLFTLIPYYLVVNKTLHGNALTVTILGFAVLQLVIQLVFFLHLGREKKPRWNLFFLGSTMGIIVLVVGGSIWIMDHLHYNMMAKDVTDKVSNSEAVHELEGEQVGTCPKESGATYKIVIKDGKVTPAHVDAQLCDTLIVRNEDDNARVLTFGTLEQHEEYAGVTSKILYQGRNWTVRLTEPGEHGFHDHMEHEVRGEFTVTP